MRPGNNSRRPRGRPNRKQHVSPRAQTFDSHGPDVRIRGNAPQVYEKYLSLARDAHSSGDRIASESYYQFAEHYFRIMNDSTDPQRGNQPPRGPQERPPARTAPVEQTRGNQEQPHVDWPVQVDGVNGSPAEQPKTDQPPANNAETPPAERAEALPAEPAEAPAADDQTTPASEESGPSRRSGKPRQRSRRRPTNGAAEKDSKSEKAINEDAASPAVKQDGADESKSLD